MFMKNKIIIFSEKNIYFSQVSLQVHPKNLTAIAGLDAGKSLWPQLQALLKRAKGGAAGDAAGEPRGLRGPRVWVDHVEIWLTWVNLSGLKVIMKNLKDLALKVNHSGNLNMNVLFKCLKVIMKTWLIGT